MTQFIAAKDPW